MLRKQIQASKWTQAVSYGSGGNSLQEMPLALLKMRTAIIEHMKKKKTQDK